MKKEFLVLKVDLDLKIVHGLNLVTVYIFLKLLFFVFIYEWREK